MIFCFPCTVFTNRLFFQKTVCSFCGTCCIHLHMYGTIYIYISISTTSSRSIWTSIPLIHTPPLAALSWLTRPYICLISASRLVCASHFSSPLSFASMCRSCTVQYDSRCNNQGQLVLKKVIKRAYIGICTHLLQNYHLLLSVLCVHSSAVDIHTCTVESQARLVMWCSNQIKSGRIDPYSFFIWRQDRKAILNEIESNQIKPDQNSQGLSERGPPQLASQPATWLYLSGFFFHHYMVWYLQHVYTYLLFFP